MIENLNISRRTYWLGGMSIVLVLSIIWIWYERSTNKEIADNIMKATGGDADTIVGSQGSSGAAKFGDSRDLGISKIMSPSFWRTNPNNVTIWAKNADGSNGPAIKLAQQIYDANSSIPFNDKPASVVSAFRSLKNKEDVSKLADVFAGLYKTDLYNYLQGSWFGGDCSPEQDTCYGGLTINYLKQVYDIIKKLN